MKKLLIISFALVGCNELEQFECVRCVKDGQVEIDICQSDLPKSITIHDVYAVYQDTLVYNSVCEYY